MRIVLPHPQWMVLAFVSGVLLFTAPIARGQGGGQQTDDDAPLGASGGVVPRPVLVFSSERHLPDSLWAALFVALRANLPDVAAKVPANEANPEFIRGDDPATGTVRAGKAITVYLRGDCRPSVQNSQFPWGARLGWVNEADGFIMPVVHVECTEIGEEIARRTQWMNRKERTAAMSEAVARVVLHEWVHIATQSAAHGSDGVTKARFGVDDLLRGDQTGNHGIACR